MNLTEKAKQAISEMFRDTNVPQQETDDNLQEVIVHCDELRATLEEE